MLIKNFYNLHGGLSKRKKSLKKKQYKDYFTLLFAYLFLILFIFYSIKDTLASIESTTDKQYQSKNNLIQYYDTEDKVFNDSRVSVAYYQKSFFNFIPPFVYILGKEYQPGYKISLFSNSKMGRHTDEPGI